MERIQINGVFYRLMPDGSYPPELKKRVPTPRMIDRKCKNCGGKFQARAADVKRGWGNFCDKSCKASKQEKTTGQFYNYRGSGVSRQTYIEHSQEYGGTPQFNRRTGEYEGFTSSHFDNIEHDCNKDF